MFYCNSSRFFSQMTIFFFLFSRGVVCLCAEFPQETVAVKGTPSQLNIRTSNLRCHLSPKQCEICKYLWVQRKVFNNVYNSIANYNQTQKAIMFFHYVFFCLSLLTMVFQISPRYFCPFKQNIALTFVSLSLKERKIVNMYRATFCPAARCKPL